MVSFIWSTNCVAMCDAHNSAAFVVSMSELNKEQPTCLYTVEHVLKANAIINKPFCTRLNSIFLKHNEFWTSLEKKCKQNLPNAVIRISAQKKLGFKFCNTKKKVYVFKKTKPHPQRGIKKYWLPPTITESQARVFSKTLNLLRLLKNKRYSRIIAPGLNVAVQTENVERLKKIFKKINKML